MTSVPNRLPLLNGNNLLIFLLILSGISSCASKKITTTQKVEVVAINTNSAKISNSTKSIFKNKEDSIRKKPEVFDLDNNSNKPVINTSSTSNYEQNKLSVNVDPNRIYNIAVVLPFHIDQIPLGKYEDDTTKQLSADSKYAMDFYLGCQMAREKYSSENLKTNVYFLDDRNDSTAITELFARKPFPNVDFIIGPLYIKNLTVLADYAKKTQIPLLSPMVNSIYIKDNPYLFYSTASLISQYTFIIEQVKRKQTSLPVEVVFDEKDSTAESISIFKKLADKYFSYGAIKYTPLYAWSDAAKALYTSDTLSDRTVVIYSSKESYIKSIIGKLKTLKNLLQIYTSANAKNTKNLVDSKNTDAIFTVYPFNSNSINNSFFATKFEDKFKKKPTETVNQAYDLMLYLFSLIDTNKQLQDSNYNYTANKDYTQTKFLFKPILNNQNNPDYFDNVSLNLFKYTNGNFVPVTP